MLYSPLDISGKPIRPPDRPGTKKCPNCKRYYNEVIIRKDGKKVTYHCPFCDYELDE